MGSSLNLKGGSSTPKSIVETFSQANTFVEGDVLRYDTATSTWVKAQADSAENSEVAGIVSGSSTTSFDLTYSGYISVPALAGISAPVLFLDSTTAGGLTASPPSAIGTVVKPVMTKTTNGTGYIVTNYLGTQIGGSSTVAIDEIQPVGTVVPFAGSVIPDSWLECNGNSYAVGAYPYLYSKLQYSSGDRAPAYGYVANITVGNSNSPAYAVGNSVSQTATGLDGTVLSLNGTNPAGSGVITLTVQVIPTYNSSTKNFVQPNAVFSNAAVTIGSVSSTISAVSTTHFNTPDLRGRFPIGVNTSRLPTTDDLESDTANNSAISGIYSLGSEGGQEFVVATPVTIKDGTGTSINAINNIGPSSNIANLPPYTVVRYIIKASPYTRAAIIDGIDIPYTSLLVGDLRDGTLRPGGIGEDLLFKTNDGTSGVEKMRLTNTGFLGIGTTTPQSRFVVSQGDNALEFQPQNAVDVSFIQALNRTTNLFTTTLDFRAKDFIFRSGSGLGTLINMNSSGGMNIPAITESTSTNSGVLTLGGGAGIAKNLTVGGGISAAGGITFSGLTRITNDATATSPTVAAFTVAGGIGAKGLHVGSGGLNIAGPLNVTSAGAVNMASAVVSNSTNTGALTVEGGVGIKGALYVGGITTAGGISMGGALTVGGGITAATLDCSGQVKSGSISTGTFQATSLNATATTQSNGVGSGALVVGGGAGIGLALNVGGGITAARLDLGSGAIKSGNINCGDISSSGTFLAASLNATATTTSTNTGSGSLVVAGGAGIASALHVGGGISAAGNLNLGAPRNYTSTSPYGNMIRALGFHNNTKIQLVASGEGSGTFIGNGTTAGSALLMWAGEPQLTYSGSGIGYNLNANPGSTAETRQFTEQAQAFVRFTDNGRIGFHTSAVGATASLTPKVAILSTGGLDVQSEIASTSSASGALVVTGAGGVGIGGALNVGGGISAGGALTVGGGITAARLDVSNGIKLSSGGFNTSTFVNITDAATSTSTGSGALIVAGGAGISGALHVGGITTAGGITMGGALTVGGAAKINNATASTSTAIGALTVVGGVGIGGALHVGGITTAGGISMGGALTVGGGLGVTGGGITFDGSVLIRNSTASDSILTGALTVRGGVGIAGDLSVHAIRVTGNGQIGRGISFGACAMNIPSGTAPMFAARAWGVATWSGSSVSLSNAGNIASVTYIGNRKFTFTFTSNMPTADYVVNVNAQRLQISSTLESAATVITERTVSSFTIGVEARNGDQIIDSSGNRVTSLQVAVFC